MQDLEGPIIIDGGISLQQNMNGSTNTPTIILRPAQEEVLAYRAGRMAVSAVPGSGKTFTLSLLAATLIGDGRVDLSGGQQLLIVTFLNTSVDNFRANIRKQLMGIGLPDAGYDVRTLHSLALEIVRWAGETPEDELVVLDEIQSRHTLESSVDSWITDNPHLWELILGESNLESNSRKIVSWRNTTIKVAGEFIRVAKNDRLAPGMILRTLQDKGGTPDEDDGEPNPARSPFLHMLAGIYDRYQSGLARQGGLDYDDLIWRATSLLDNRPDLLASLRYHWPYILEDEAQDSVPLQEVLLDQLTGDNGNWVRVGDPNQAITSTFTAAHPRYFSRFINRPDVTVKTLPNSGRSARLIIGAANALLNWAIDHHPVPEVRHDAFRRQDILPTPAGDSQPNPPDSEADLVIRRFNHREDEELPTITRLATEYSQQNPHHTIAILTSSNKIGFEIAKHLDNNNAHYDNKLRSNSREQEVATIIHAVLAVLANPVNANALQVCLSSLMDNGLITPMPTEAQEDPSRYKTLLRSIKPESLIFPKEGESIVDVMPQGVASQEEIEQLEQFAAFVRDALSLRELPIDDLTLALADKLFGSRVSDGEREESLEELDLAIAYQIAMIMRRWREAQPDWRLPELAAQLSSVANGRRTLRVMQEEAGFEPTPGKITLMTQHRGKGLEWDAVFLVGIDGMWIPSSLDSPFMGIDENIGGDPGAEARAQLSYLMYGQAGLYPRRTATESAHIEVICERLRLLYVGVTRARRRLYISRSRSSKQQPQSELDPEAQPTTAIGALYRYLKQL